MREGVLLRNIGPFISVLCPWLFQVCDGKNNINRACPNLCVVQVCVEIVKGLKAKPSGVLFQHFFGDY